MLCAGTSSALKHKFKYTSFLPLKKQKTNQKKTTPWEIIVDFPLTEDAHLPN